jgi:hypothetical protein
MKFSTKSQKDNICSTNTDKEEGCCTPQPKGKASCPSCRQKAKGVLKKTLDALLKEEAKAKLSSLEGFYYCKTPTCAVVYFREETVLTQEDVSVIVGLKEGAVPATVCYCFDWTKEKIRAELELKGETRALEDIKAKMENPGCSCEIRNPSGGCCLGDVGQAIKAIQKSLQV